MVDAKAGRAKPLGAQDAAVTLAGLILQLTLTLRIVPKQGGGRRPLTSAERAATGTPSYRAA